MSKQPAAQTPLCASFDNADKHAHWERTLTRSCQWKSPAITSGFQQESFSINIISFKNTLCCLWKLHMNQWAYLSEIRVCVFSCEIFFWEVLTSVIPPLPVSGKFATSRSRPTAQYRTEQEKAALLQLYRLKMTAIKDAAFKITWLLTYQRERNCGTACCHFSPSCKYSSWDWSNKYEEPSWIQLLPSTSARANGFTSFNYGFRYRFCIWKKGLYELVLSSKAKK